MRRDNIRMAAAKLRRRGLDVDILPHKTSLRIRKPDEMDWRDLKRALRSVLQPRRGSVFLCSETTGRAFICNNAGNQPGRFERL